MKAISRAERQRIATRHIMTWSRRYFIVVGLIAIGFVRWKYNLHHQAHKNFGKDGFATWVDAMDYGSYFLTMFLLLCPWWQLGDLVATLGYAVALPICTYVIVGLGIVDIVYVHQQTLFYLFLLSGVLAQIVWLFLPLREEIQRAKDASLAKERLRQNHRERILLVERFILGIEGESHEVSRWNRFADASGRGNPMGMGKRVEVEFERWVNSGA
jgi:hypothetical protein